MKKINNYSSLSGIRKYELTEILESISEIVEKYDPETLGINGMYEKLIAQKAALTVLKEEPAQTYPLQGVYTVQYKKREVLIQAIKSGVIAIEKAALASQTENAVKVIPIIKRYLKDLKSKNRIEKLEIITVLLKELDNTESTETLNALGLKVYFDELKLLQADIAEHATGSKISRITYHKSQTQSVKTAVTGSVRNMLRSIELASIDHPEKDFSGLLNELNNYMSNFSIAVKARRTRKVNASNNKSVAGSATTTATAG